MFERILRWVDERIPLSSSIRLGLEEEIPGGARYAYTLGSATLVVFLLQIVTGVWQLFYYVPSVDSAYNSLSYLRTEVPFGWLIHGLHYWGANAIIVLVGLHIARVFIFGAYKYPRELTWLAGVALLFITAALVFTGAPLPWDQRGYWAAEVGTSIAGTVPLVGDAVKRLLRGGDLMGQLALSRMFIMHVAILPAVLGGFLIVHLAAFRRFGSVGPWDETKRQHAGPFWPDQVFRDAVVATFLVFLLIVLCVFAPPPFAGPADPLDTSYVPKPEWNFLFLYEALKFLPGSLEALGTVGIPLLGTVILVLVPFLGRSPERNPFRRPFAMAGGAIWVGAVVVLTLVGYSSQTEEGKAGTPAPAPSVSGLSPAAQKGSELVQSLGCTGCHSLDGKGGTVGPDLSNEAHAGRTRSWIKNQIRDPKSHDPGTIMPSYPSLTDRQLDQIADYLLSLGTGGAAPGAKTDPAPADPPSSSSADPPSSGPAAAKSPATPAKDTKIHGLPPSAPGSFPGPPGPASLTIGSAEHGGRLFQLYCVSCHGVDGKGGVPNPGSAGGTIPPLNPISRALASDDPEVFATNIDRILQHGLIPKGPMPAKKMLVFGMTQSLTQEEISNLEAYILKLNGVDRARVLHPGIPPKTFFLLVMGGGVLTIAGLAAYRTRARAKKE